MEIRLRGVGFRYGRKQVLRDLDWTIRPGVTGLVGENGAGKTTLLSVLVGLRKPQAGTVTLGDAARPALGFVPQRFSVPGEMRLVDVVSYTAWINGIDRRDTDDAARRALEAVALADRANDRVRTLSGGQRQRLGVAAGLAHNPDVLVLDEPTVGLDPTQRVRVREVIASLGQSRMVLLSTHVLDDVHHLCQRIGMLAGGQIFFDGTVEELVTEMSAAEAHNDPEREANALESPLERAYRLMMNRHGGHR